MRTFRPVATEIVCALLMLSLGAGTLLSQEDPTLETPQNIPSEQHRFLPMLPQLSSIIPHRILDRPQTAKESTVYSNLPGFGTAPSGIRSQPPPSFLLGEQFLGGSLELAPSLQRLVPAIYIEGEGYVPITHPAIQPYLDPESDRPETNPAIVMVPEYRLMGYDDSEFSIPESSRVIDASGATLLSRPKRENTEPIVISAQKGWSKRTEEFDIFFLDGDCGVRQGANCVQGSQAVVWVAHPKKDSVSMREVTVYVESDSTERPLFLELDPENMDEIGARIYDKKWFGRFNTRTVIQTLIMNPDPPKAQDPAIYHRALAVISPDYSVIRQAQFVVESSQLSSSGSTPPRFRRMTLNSRGDNLMDIRFDPYPNNPERGIVVITKGLNLVIEGVTGDDLLMGDVVDIMADHAVIWSNNPARIRQGGETKESSSNDFEVYLEGNIIFRDGARTIEAQRMYYDAKNKIAYILDGHLSTPIIGIKGISGGMRMKAEVLRQLGDGMFTAKNAYVTTSQLGEPTYSLRSRTMTMTERTSTGFWGDSEPRTQQILVSENNYLAVRTMPIFYWPWMAADLKDPTFYIKNISYGNSSIYGNQIKTVWNPFQLLNIRNRPSWLDASLYVGWFEKRGIGHGVSGYYTPSSFCSIPGQVGGSFTYWGIYDKGKTGDRLGGPRSRVPFPEDYRYHFIWKHRQDLESLWKCKGPWTLSAQIGKTSDRNFNKQYFNNDWINSPNATTSVELQRRDGNSTTSIFTEYALDKFYTNANWLPRLDHYLLGQSLLNDKLTWYEHTRVGFVNYNTASSPYAPDMAAWNQDARYFRYLPWELTTNSPTNMPPRPGYPNDPTPLTIDSSFETFSTRHEFDLPLNIGPVRCVPYVLGDFSHWGKDRSGKDVQRFYGQGGVRLNLPFWKVMPNCSSRTWYVNGLAHKLDFDAELSYAKSDQSMDNLIMTDALDSWSIEDFRRRYSVTTFNNFGATIPAMFDPRYYALRSGTAGNVSTNNMEIADDLTLCRFGMTHRLQTKRGPVGRRYIVDWVTLSAHFNFYPESKQNYGESIGLIDYDFLWHVGDRFSLFSSGLYDVFEEGQQITRIGGMWNRPARGNVGVMLDRLQGVIDRTYLTFNVGYTMNEKYAMNYTTSFDIKDEWKNTGHNFIFTRTGESFRIMVGALYSEARDEWSFTFGLEPVFMRGIANKMTAMSSRAQQMANK